MFKYYNMDQVILPLDLEVKLQEKDIAYTVMILWNRYLMKPSPVFLRDTGNPAYHPTVFGFLKANLGFTRMSVRGKEKVKNELGFAFIAVNLRKYTARTPHSSIDNKNNPTKNGSNHQLLMFGTIFHYFWLVMSQPLFLILP